jgi:hypothetical protein
MVNPVVRAVVGSRLVRYMRWGVLRFTGRRSGTTYAIPVGVHAVDGVDTVFTHEKWRLNFRDGADVTVTRRGVPRRGHGRLVEDPARVGAALATALRTTKPRDLGIAIDKGYAPTAADLAAMGECMIEIRYDGA